MATTAEITAVIDTNNRALCAELAKGNAGAVARMYATGARLMPPNADFVESANLAGYWQGAIDMGVKGGVLKSVSVEVHGDTAIEVGVYTLHGPNSVAIDSGKYLVVWKQEGSAWKLFLDIFNSSRPAA